MCIYIYKYVCASSISNKRDLKTHARNTKRSDNSREAKQNQRDVDVVVLGNIGLGLLCVVD